MEAGSGTGAGSDVPAVAHDEDDEVLHCYRHRDRETALQCLSCDRPICVDCATHAPVGIKCPECSRTPRAARGAVPHGRLVAGVSTGAVTGLALGTLLALVHVPLLGFILAYGVGVAVGTATRRASGGFRDPALARAASISAAVGVLLLPALRTVASGGGGVTGLAFTAVAAIFAAVAAHQRAS